MNYVVTGWWLLFLTAVGLVAGSFLNVIVYRLPRDQSLRSPLWSACPFCRHRIRWYDNLPVLSFLVLGGRCRDCRAPISNRYAIIELAMGFVVLMLLDSFMIGGARAGLGSQFGLTDHLEWNWPILLAHVVLFAALLAMSAIDLEHYWVDIRCTNFAVACGFALHALWTPRYSRVGTSDGAAWPRPGDDLAIVSVFALVGLGIVWLWYVFQAEELDENDVDSAEAVAPPPESATRLIGSLPAIADEGQDGRPAEPLSHTARGTIARLSVWLAIIMFVGLLSLLFVEESGEGSVTSYRVRAIVPLLLFFFLIVEQSTVVRESDSEIITAIEEERFTARRMVLGEFAHLLPAIALGGIALVVIADGGELYQRMGSFLHAEVGIRAYQPLAAWQPVYGLATAAAGFVVGGALGWAVRIFFTLLFGKEAFGVGDIHLMAAAGCVVGWQVVVVGFVLTCGLAMLGWMCTLPFKRSRAIPLGPWLALAFLVAVLFYDRILEIERVQLLLDAFHMLTR